MSSLTSKSLSIMSLCIGILLLAGSVFAANNILNVTCVDESGKALPGTKVQILALGDPKWQDSKGIPKWQDSTADSAGVARFDKLDDGVYRVVARPSGLAPGLHDLVVLKNGAQESVTITCPAGDPAKKFYFEDASLGAQFRAAMAQANTSFQSNNFVEAEKNVRAALEAYPSNPDALYFLAVALARQKKWDQAKEILEKGVLVTNALVSIPQQKDAKGQLQPNPYLPIQKMMTGLLPQLPSLKLRIEASEAMNAKDFKTAIAKLEEAAKNTPNDTDLYYNLALSLGYEKQWDAAGKVIDKAIALRADDAAFLDLKKRLTANAEIDRIKVIVDQGDALYKNKDYAGALKKYEESLPLLPEPALQASVYAAIGRTNGELKQFPEAIQAYRKSIELAGADNKPKFQAAFNLLYETMAQEFINKKEYDQAFAAYADAGKLAFRLGQDWANKNETADLAIMAFERVLKADPQNAEAYFQLGTLYYFNKKDNAKAKEMLTKYQEMGKDEKLLEQSRNIIAVIDRKK
jgi:tetratricopeptide (TPR) repeat protein